ncbi:hypothetical protein H4R34_000045 [Dimargaris verticillata]|uniref:Splicing factor YJU2 n=1 Tax=Dimargaris verticillata TaxID=2761393 RepID=A0A9W8BB69_9FUNG|nr:hypothetical protein H4R34_000045 [Dimargaris verticillata]
MIESVYIIDKGSVILEKHWRSDYGPAVVNQFLRCMEEQPLDTLKPILELTHRYVGIHIKRSDLVFLGLVSSEVSPFLVLEFLNRFHSVLIDYFGKVAPSVIKEHFVTIYKLLEEMLDYGYPLTTNTSMLKDLVPVPNIVSKVMQTVTGASGFGDQKPEINSSLIPWRKQGIKYKNNEIYVDVVEEVDAILERSGAISSIDITGQIMCIPDLTMSFANPKLLDDCSFHPCVRIRKFESDNVLSFIPPDGQFKLASYRINNTHPYQPPLLARLDTTLEDHTQSFELALDAGQTFGNALQQVSLLITLPENATNILAKPTEGTASIDTRLKNISWNHSTIAANAQRIRSNTQQPLAISMQFTVSMYAISSLRISGLRLASETYNFYKYYPPDFDPSLVPRAKKPKDQQQKVRLMAPFTMRCTTCGEFIHKGKKFNARKETVHGEMYLTLKIFRFYIRCPRCAAEITFKTDPQNLDYVAEHGAVRNFESIRVSTESLAEKRKRQEEEDADDPMKALESRTKESKRELEMLEALDELRTRNACAERIGSTKLLEHVTASHTAGVSDKPDDTLTAEDEQLVQDLFHNKSVANEATTTVTTAKDALASARIQLLGPAAGRSGFTSKFAVSKRSATKPDTMTSLGVVVKRPKPVPTVQPTPTEKVGLADLLGGYSSSEENSDATE